MELGLKKNCLIGVTRPTLFLPPTLNIFIFLCAKKKKKKLKTPQNKYFHLVSQYDAYTGLAVTEKVKMCIVPFVFVCVSYILCSGMWNIDFKKKKKIPTYLPYFFFYVTPIKQFFYSLLRISCAENNPMYLYKKWCISGRAQNFR